MSKCCGNCNHSSTSVGERGLRCFHGYGPFTDGGNTFTVQVSPGGCCDHWSGSAGDAGDDGGESYWDRYFSEEHP
jgi:hypothetical protein